MRCLAKLCCTGLFLLPALTAIGADANSNPASYAQLGNEQFAKAKVLLTEGKAKDAYPLLVSASYYDPITVSAAFDSLKGVDLSQAQDALINMGWGLYVGGYYQAALYRFEQELKIDKNNLNALRGKGFCLVQLGKYDEATAVLTQVVQHSKAADLQPVTTYFDTTTGVSVPVPVDATTMLGWAQYFAGDYAKAQQTFSQVIQQHPNWVNAHLGLAYTYKARSDDRYKQEMDWMNQQVTGYGISIPDYAPQALVKGQMIYNTAWSNVLAKKYEVALEDFAQAQKLLPANYQWLVADGKAWIAYYQGNVASAEIQFKAIIANNPNAYLSYKGLAYIALDDKQYDDAFANAQKLFALNPTQPAAVYVYMVKAFVDANKSIYADPILATGLYYYPQSGELLFYKAKLLWQQGDKAATYPLLLSASYYAPVAVSAEFDSLQGLDVSNVKIALLNMGWGLYMVGQNQEALKRFDQYVATLKPNQPLSVDDLNALRGQGFCEVRLGQNDAAQMVLNKVLADPRSSQLQPVVTYAYPTPDKAVPIYVDAATTLGWAQYSAGNYQQAESTFRGVLKQHPDWLNARLGLAYTLKGRDKNNNVYLKELENINNVVPGYGAIYDAVMPSPLSVTLQATQSWFGEESAKLNAQTGQASFSYAPSAYIQFGGFGTYQYIHFKQIAASSPAENSRLGYFVNLYTPLVNHVGYFGVATKGNYFLNSAYNDDGANARLMPYFGVIYKTPDQLNTIEPGFAYEDYHDGVNTKVDQYSLSLSTLMLKNWLFALTGYLINYSNTVMTENDYAVVPSATYFIGDKQSVGVTALIGKRRQPYDLTINKVYDVRDQEQGGGSINYTYHFSPHFSLFGDVAGEHMQAASTNKGYNAYYLTVGAII